MDFRIADTFTAGLARLTNEEQKAVKTTAFDLQVNPANPGHQFHKLDRAKDKHFWSVRVSRDIRLIVHKTDDGLLLCYVGHHNDAYAWAERRKIERHPKTGAAQLVEIRERVEEIVVPTYIEAPRPTKAKPTLFVDASDDELLSYGVPPEWLADVKGATEDTLFEVADHLPREAAEALLELAIGNKPAAPTPVSVEQNPFEHPAALQRFRLMTNADELGRALDAPWETWAVFLHPAQQTLVEKRFAGPARVAGSAGTGKTVVALHRAVFLARKDVDAKVLVTTFSPMLARMLDQKLNVLVGGEGGTRQRIVVRAIDEFGVELYSSRFGKPSIASEATAREHLRRAAMRIAGHAFKESFLWNEWSSIVDAWQVKTWDEYRGLARLGRKTRLGDRQRQQLWEVLEVAMRSLAADGLVTINRIFGKVAEAVAASTIGADFQNVVVDEAQDISVAQLRFLAAIAGKKPNGLFFAGDLGQRIFQSPFSWKSLGVDVRGRSHTLKINYRTSHQIRRQADRLLPSVVSDVDGESDDRHRTLSIFNGPEPTVVIARDEDDERSIVSEWLRGRLRDGARPAEIAVFVRSALQVTRAAAAVAGAGLAADGGGASGVTIATMHEAKGLEFRSVVVMACDDEVIPLQERIEGVGDSADLDEVYTSERHLLYVACTRARDHLLVVGVAPESEFLGDLQS